MEQKSMTALVSAFARAYHHENNDIRIFEDRVARSLIHDEEYSGISNNMSKGINFFNPEFSGTEEEALKWVVDNQLAPSPLGRAAFAERLLETSVRTGARQYLILGSGYDTFAYRQPRWARDIEIFELDHPMTATDKRDRLAATDIDIPTNVDYIETDFTDKHWTNSLMNNDRFDNSKLSFCSALGLAYYLAEEDFKSMLDSLSSIIPEGSAIVFDYPDEKSYTDEAGDRAKNQAMMAGAANEKMMASYSYRQMEELLSDKGFLIYEHLNPDEVTEQYFSKYNEANPEHIMTAFDNVNYCLAVKKDMIKRD